jgi:hypothetical protein
MNLAARAALDVPPDLNGELARYGGLNPYGEPLWRVALAQNVLRQSFGIVTHMPDVDPDSDTTDLEPEGVEEGEFWTPRYECEGWILERWFPASSWMASMEWENAMGADGVTPMMGEWPRHGQYYMVSTEAYEKLPSIDFWKATIQAQLREQARSPHDPATYLSQQLYLERRGKELKEEAYLREVDHLHKSVVKPMLATIGKTAQRVRDEVQAEMRCRSVLAAG